MKCRNLADSSHFRYSGTSDGTRRNMEELMKETDAKVQMLKYTSAKTRGVVEKRNLGAVERQCENLKELVKEIDALKLRVEQAMFKAGKCTEKVEKWSSSVEGPIAEADG